MNIDEIDIFLTKKEYMEKAGLTASGFSRRINHTENPLTFTDFDPQIIKKLPTKRFDQELAIALRNNQPVRLISIKENPIVPSIRAK